jgi:hypothetical protein
MKKKVICLLLLCLFILSGTAFATNWVAVPGSNGDVYVDADSSVKQGSKLTFWFMNISHADASGDWAKDLRNGVLVNIAKNTYKIEADLRTPRKMRYIYIISWDRNDNRITKRAQNAEWARGDNAIVDLALSLAKEGQDSVAEPPPVSDRY